MKPQALSTDLEYSSYREMVHIHRPPYARTAGSDRTVTMPFGALRSDGRHPGDSLIWLPQTRSS